MNTRTTHNLLGPVKLYSGNDMAQRKPEFVCKVRSGAHIFWPLVLAAAAAGILISGIRGVLPLAIAILSSACCALFAFAGLATWRSQKSHRKWFLCVAAQEIILHIGEDASTNSLPVMLGIPISQLEWVRECLGERQVKSYDPETSATFTEHWAYLELKPRFDPAMLASVIEPRQQFFGVKLEQKIITVKNGLVRILWLSPAFRVRPDITSTVERLRTYLPVAQTSRNCEPFHSDEPA